jgi:AraC family transcriptional activator of pobA
MIETETLKDFYRRVQGDTENLSTINTGQGHFNMFKRAASHQQTPFIRRDYYKITLVHGQGTIHYADRSIAIDGQALVFSGVAEPSSCEAVSARQDGWVCLFSPEFMSSRQHQSALQDYPYFRPNGEHIITLNDKQYLMYLEIFEKMASELAAPYHFKYGLIRSYLHIVMYEALKIGPPLKSLQLINAAARITTSFLQLLEQQFPIDSPARGLQLKTAADYATNLSVHINHLNRSVKEVTGKTTTRHIAERILVEAQALLKYSDWNVNQIAAALGFEEPAYFVNFFRKNTGKPPGRSRSVIFKSE